MSERSRVGRWAAVAVACGLATAVPGKATATTQIGTLNQPGRGSKAVKLTLRREARKAIRARRPKTLALDVRGTGKVPAATGAASRAKRVVRVRR